jgi:hypothetical protein
MRITFRANAARNQVNESSALTITAKVWDDSTEVWTAQVPTTLKYRIDCLDSGCQVLDWTSMLSVTGAQNAIQNDCNEFERKQLTLMANSGLSTQYQDSFTWSVRNLSGQT